MATWEDGPEYAPRERPQYFADAPLPPLEQAPPSARPADGQPTARPRFEQPAAPVAPLETLVGEPADERDPSRPFDVVTATMTTESAWGSTWASSGSLSPEQPLVPSSLAGAFGPVPATGAPWPALEAPAGPAGFPPPPVDGPPSEAGAPFPHVPHVSQPEPYAYPAPGTPGWFAPPPTAYGEQPQPGRVDARAVVEAATPGLCVCLAVGGLIYLLAPVMLVMALFLSTRVEVAPQAVRTIFRVAAGAVAFFAVVGLYRSVFDGDPWWSFVAWWSVAICWASLGVLLLTVGQSLRRPLPPVPPNPWG